MKKIFAALLMLTLLMALCACGQEEAPAPTATPEAAPTEEVAPATETPVEESAEPAEQELSDFEKAEACVGQGVDALYAAIGEPNSSDYAPSCLGEGEDGILYYDGFSVYTYREGESERVDTVLAD